MDSDKIDFSALDPKRDSEHFENMVRTVMSQVSLRPLPVHPFILDVSRWGRAVLAGAALVAIVSWVPKMMGASVETVTESTDPLEQVSSWAHAGEIPAHADVSQVLGDLHAN